MLKAAVTALVAFMTLPTVVVIVVSFNPTAILSFPPSGFSFRWYENALTYPQFQRAALNSLWVTLGAVAVALPVGRRLRSPWSAASCACPPCGRRSSSRRSWFLAWRRASASSSSPPPSA